VPDVVLAAESDTVNTALPGVAVPSVAVASLTLSVGNGGGGGGAMPG
jgi:hypothetical protein